VGKFWFKLLACWLAVISFAPARGHSQSSTNDIMPLVAVASEADMSSTYVRDVLPILLGKCFSCHNDQTRFLPNWSDYSTAYAKRVEIKRRVWDSWQGRYYKEPMPIGNSPQCQAMTEADRQTIKRWVEQGAVYGVLPAQASAVSRTDRLDAGRRLFGMVCLPCHQANGQGLPDRFPPLAASDFLNGDKQRAIQTLLDGRQGEITVNGRKFNGSMPRLPFDDAQIASVLTYVYGSFGNSGQEVRPDEVKLLRAQNNVPAHNAKSVRTDNKPGQWE
jgi:mono/diheme cytochrome c family protein